MTYYGPRAGSQCGCGSCRSRMDDFGPSDLDQILALERAQGLTRYPDPNEEKRDAWRRTNGLLPPVQR